MFDYAKKMASSAASSASAAAHNATAVASVAASSAATSVSSSIAVASVAASSAATSVSSSVSCSVEKYSSISTKCGGFKSDSKKTAVEPSPNCGRSIPMASSYGECVFCGVTCCAACKRLVAVDHLPEDLKGGVVDKAVLQKSKEVIICPGNCWTMYSTRRAEDFRFKNDIFIMEKTTDFISNTRRDFYEEPTAKEDTKYNMARRGLLFTGLVADTLGVWQVSYAAKLIQGVVAGKTLFDIIMKPEIRALIGPLMTQLKLVKIDKPTDVITLYYLACKHGLISKSDPNEESDGFLQHRHGVVTPSADLALLDLLGSYVGPAGYLYHSILPAPHEDNKWSEWYLSEISRDDGWKLIRLENKAQQVPDGSLCPGFALFARDEHSTLKRNGDSGFTASGRCPKEVLISIKGSSSGFDWGINLDEHPVPFVYTPSPASERVEGLVHGGSYRGCMNILDQFSLRGAIKKFAQQGYAVRITGHSLGAAIATVMTAELRRYFLDGGIIADVKGIAFAPPACMTSNLCEALALNDTLVVMVNREDPVPRLNIFNLIDMVAEMREFESEAQVLMKDDTEDLKKHSYTLGKSNSMVEGLSSDGIVQELNDAAANDSPAAVRTDTETKAIVTELQTENIGARLYVAGKIVYMFQDNGLDRAAVVTHDHPFLNRIRLSIDRKIDDHSLHNYLKGLRNIKAQYNVLFASTGRKDTKPALRTAQRLQSVDASGAEGSTAKSGDLHGVKPAPCHICHKSPAWPYILKSPANISRVADNCRACGNVVCVICAPAGDEVPDEGINNYRKLPDRRLALPGIGLFTEQRVCMICYSQSYFL